MKNWFTLVLAFIGAIGCAYSIGFLFFLDETNNLSIFVLMLIIIIVLELLPIQMVSGEPYSASGILVLFLAVYQGLDYAFLAILIGTFACFFNMFKTIKFTYFPFFVTTGMYMVAITFAFGSYTSLASVNLWIAVGLAALTYEVVNIFLLDFINKVTYKEKMFHRITVKLKETIVPVLISIIVLPILLVMNTTLNLLTIMIYTLFFILIIIFFSRHLTRQIFLRRSASEAFISILEQSISEDMIGHGNRVASILENLMDDLNYPKTKRNDLLQAAINHDIGKSMLPSHIFKKRGALTLSEERQYQSHPEKATELVKSMFNNDSFADWILHHHERWDGKGFPHQLAGNDIPLESRILALGNELDHIIARHKCPVTVLELLQEKAGSVLAPDLVANVKLHHIESSLAKIESLESTCTKIHNSNTAEKTLFIEETSTLGDSFFIQVKNGKVLSQKTNLNDEFFLSLAEKAIELQKHIHEHYLQQNILYDIHAQPHPNGEVTIFAHDITPSIDYRRQLEKRILESYQDVIYSLSNGKIQLHSSKLNLEKQLGDFVGEISIQNTYDVPKSREYIKPILETYPTEIKMMKIHLSITEAVTNVVKHATQGNFAIYQCEDTLQFLISDKGSGIPLHEIPKTILVTGYSSKHSLGQGFNMIAKFSDKVQICTSTEGTSILLEYRKKEKWNEKESGIS